MGRREGRREDRQRKTDNQVTHQLVHSDTLCIRTKKDCSATRLCIYFKYLLNCTRYSLNTNHNGTLHKRLDIGVILALANIILMMQGGNEGGRKGTEVTKVRQRESVRACVRACVRARACVCVRVCLCVV